jgi:MFS family permease
MSAESAAAPAETKKGHLFGFEFPDFSTLKDHRVQTLIYAKNVQKMGIATLSYGAAIYLADQGASQLQISLVTCTGYVAALLFGAQGGLVVDKVSKRNAMALGYAAMAILCFTVPFVFGTSVADLVLLAFLIATLATVTAPSIKAAVALVATPAAMATVASVLNLFGSFGTAIGQAFVAPILIKVSGIHAVMIGAGIILLSGGIWSLKVPKEEGQTEVTEAVREVDWKPRALELRGIARWVMSKPAIATIVLVGAIVFALGETVSSLIPIYVRDVLDANPSYSVYIFAPAGIGYLAGMLTAPWAIKKWEERRFGFGAFIVMAIGVMCFGFVNALAPILGPISPTRIFELFGADLSNAMLAAGFIAMPANYGSTATSAAVQVFINARVPLANQGGVFGMEKVVENMLTVVAMLSLGGLATAIGSQAVFVIAPIVVLSIVVWLIRYSNRISGGVQPSPIGVVEELWQGPEGEDAGTRPAETETVGTVTDSQ